MKKKTTNKESKVVVPFSKEQSDLSVSFKKWTGDYEVRYDLLIRTKNSIVSHSLSTEQVKLLKEAILKVNI